jgi:hypothetical protein
VLLAREETCGKACNRQRRCTRCDAGAMRLKHLKLAFRKPTVVHSVRKSVSE